MTDELGENAGAIPQGLGILIHFETIFEKLKNFQCKILISSCCSVEKLKSILPSMQRMGYRGSKI